MQREPNRICLHVSQIFLFYSLDCSLHLVSVSYIVVYTFRSLYSFFNQYTPSRKQCFECNRSLFKECWSASTPARFRTSRRRSVAESLVLQILMQSRYPASFLPMTALRPSSCLRYPTRNFLPIVNQGSIRCAISGPPSSDRCDLTLPSKVCSISITPPSRSGHLL